MGNDDDEVGNADLLFGDEPTPVELPSEEMGPDRPPETYDKIAAIKSANRMLELQQQLVEEKRAGIQKDREIMRLKRLTGRQAEEIIRLGKAVIAARAKKEEE